MYHYGFVINLTNRKTRIMPQTYGNVKNMTEKFLTCLGFWWQRKHSKMLKWKWMETDRNAIKKSTCELYITEKLHIFVNKYPLKKQNMLLFRKIEIRLSNSDISNISLNAWNMHMKTKKSYRRNMTSVILFWNVWAFDFVIFSGAFRFEYSPVF